MNCDISQTHAVFDQSQHTNPADQSEHSVLFRRRGFIETGTKQSVTDSLGREEPQQWRILEFDHSSMKTYSSRL